VTSGLALIAVVLLVWWARKLFAPGSSTRRAAWASLVLILIEALLGAGLVLLEYTEKNASPGRAVYLSAHLINTLLLLGAIAAAAWASASSERLLLLSRISGRLRLALAAALISGVSGAIAALGDTLYPASSLAEGVAAEFSAAAPALLRLRLAHPVIALAAGLFIAFLGVAMARSAPSTLLRRAALWTVALTFTQFAAGLINLVLLAPVWMQLLHLALATFLWVALVLTAFESAHLQSPKALA
jgi:heme A synthase